MTQEQLAEQCGVTVNSVGHYEGGRAVPKVDTLERIAAATGKPLAWFFQADDAAPAEPERPQPYTQSLLAQLVAAQVRAEGRQAEMSQALAALAHDRLESRAEAARTSVRLTQIEEALRALLETPEGGCQGQARCTG